MDAVEEITLCHICNERHGPEIFRSSDVVFHHSISFKKLALADLAVMTRWLAEPHVNAWWHEALTLEEVHKKYGPRIEGREPCYVYVILNGTTPVGFIQWYRWADYPEHSLQLEVVPGSAGIDLAIGEKDFTGCGIGTKAICLFIQRSHLSGF